MTKEEAKRRLLEIERCTPIHTREDIRDFEALEMAIKALSQEMTIKPCDDAISCDIAIKHLTKARMIGDSRPMTEIFAEIPSVTQKWIEHKHNGMSYIECPKCSTWFLRMYLTRNSYCPNCGCRMFEPQESEE